MRSNGITRRHLAAAGGLAAATILHWPANAAEFTYKYTSALPYDHPMTIRVLEAVAKIKAATNGRLEILCYPNNVLGGDTAMIAQAISGAVQMYSVAPDLLAPRDPGAGIMGVGFAFPDYPHAWAAVDGAVGDYFRAVAEKVGLHCLPKAFDHGFRHITSRSKPIVTPEDLHGFKIRLPVTPTAIALFRHLGAAPTPMNFNEVYTSLQTGVVDGQENPLLLIDETKLYEVQKYLSLTSHSWVAIHCSFNVAAWHRLPATIQDTVGQIMSEAALQQRQDWQVKTKTVQAHLEANGMIANQPDPAPFRAMLTQTGFYGDMKQQLGPEAWRLLQQATPLAA